MKGNWSLFAPSLNEETVKVKNKNNFESLDSCWPADWSLDGTFYDRMFRIFLNTFSIFTEKNYTLD